MFISVIIPTYNSKELLNKGLDSIMKQSFLDIEIIIIDNGSSDGTYQFVIDNYPYLKIIRNDMNMGSSVARNQGIAISRGKFIMFMDCDVQLCKNFFSKLLEIIKQMPKDIDAISPKIIDRRIGKLFSCGLKISSIYRVYDIGRNRTIDDFIQPIRIDGPNSCCAIFKRGCLDKIKEHNYFDEDFFFLFEDADLALRLKNKGFKAFFFPELICYHREGSSAFTKEFRSFLCYRNRWYMILKNKKGLGLVMFILKSFFYDFPRTIYFASTNSYFLKASKDIYRVFKSKK
ncbi:MAG: glycosyltransferase family 2 protein [Candidatus Omnitrophica bacterium]|nr:glycosyltransferase family 2 protein [Candidatus Omnitrophota bacterium]